MAHYQISYQNPHKHFIDITLTVTNQNNDFLLFQLAAWRPGRYELANFSKNIQTFCAQDEFGESLNFEKVSKDCWKVECSTTDKVIVSYNYYANILDAGSTYLDEKQLYVNPVNCCMYVVNDENSPCTVELEIPDSYQIAGGLPLNEKGYLVATNFDNLAESPFICSDSLKHEMYIVNGIPFHLWIQGNCQPNFEKVLNDFKQFTITQINSFDSFPTEDYHFLFQITPYPSYHGVEHTNSTVILMGSIDDVFTTKYDNILGICSHELYHTWNIKAIRPKEMLPYDYTKENYSRLGYVAEGVTTYMGDLMLIKSKVFSWDQFIKTQNENLKRHYENDGRHNLSVADSSFDTWLDGYSLGIPNRKTSIYADGALCMLMIDLFIIQNTNAKLSLCDVMKVLYKDFRESGYSEDDFMNLCIKYGGDNVKYVFEKFIYGTEDYTQYLNKALNVVGYYLEETLNPNLSARRFGFISVVENGKHIIKKIQDNSEADLKKLAVEDEILSINNIQLKDKKLTKVLEENEGPVSVEIKKRFTNVSINLNSNNHYALFTIKSCSEPSKDQLYLRKYWVN